MTANNKNKELIITATKFKIVEEHKGQRKVQLPQYKVSRYIDALLREYTDKGYTIHECTVYRTVLMSKCKTYFIELLNNLPNKQ